MDEIQHNGDSASQNGTPIQAKSQEEQEWTDKGNAAVREGDYEGAVNAFERAVEVDPNDARARYNLALALQYRGRDGDSELAIAGYRRAIDLDPELIEAYMMTRTMNSTLAWGIRIVPRTCIRTPSRHTAKHSS